jgi:opacity protein-like surface antigen
VKTFATLLGLAVSLATGAAVAALMMWRLPDQPVALVAAGWLGAIVATTAEMPLRHAAERLLAPQNGGAA